MKHPATARALTGRRHGSGRAATSACWVATRASIVAGQPVLASSRAAGAHIEINSTRGRQGGRRPLTNWMVAARAGPPHWQGGFRRPARMPAPAWCTLHPVWIRGVPESVGVRALCNTGARCPDAGRPPTDYEGDPGAATKSLIVGRSDVSPLLSLPRPPQAFRHISFLIDGFRSSTATRTATSERLASPLSPGREGGGIRIVRSWPRPRALTRL